MGFYSRFRNIQHGHLPHTSWDVRYLSADWRNWWISSWAHSQGQLFQWATLTLQQNYFWRLVWMDEGFGKSNPCVFAKSKLMYRCTMFDCQGLPPCLLHQFKLQNLSQNRFFSTLGTPATTRDPSFFGDSESASEIDDFPHSNHFAHVGNLGIGQSYIQQPEAGFKSKQDHHHWPSIIFFPCFPQPRRPYPLLKRVCSSKILPMSQSPRSTMAKMVGTNKAYSMARSGLKSISDSPGTGGSIANPTNCVCGLVHPNYLGNIVISTWKWLQVEELFFITE